MSPGPFERLRPLSGDLATEGNEAEGLLGNPRYCLYALRGWFECLLVFLEKEHSIPSPVAANYAGQGLNEYRVNRLRNHGVNIATAQLDVLHEIRRASNNAAHYAEHKGFFTPANAQKALREARLIRDWLLEQYVKKPPSRTTSRITTSGVAAASGSLYDKEFPNWFEQKRRSNLGQIQTVARNSMKVLVICTLIIFGIVALANYQSQSPPPAPQIERATLIMPASTPPRPPTPAPIPPKPAPALPRGPVFPTKISSKYVNEPLGLARMHTCTDQYNTNMATNASAGLLWIKEGGGGYYSECNKRLMVNPPVASVPSR